MKIIDFIFYKIFLFGCFLKRPIDGAKWSAILCLTTFNVLFIACLICYVGLLYDILILHDFFDHYGAIFLIVCHVLLFPFWYFRYYRYLTIDEIKDSYDQIRGLRRHSLNFLIYFLMIAIPVLFFILARLLIFGQVKWW